MSPAGYVFSSKLHEYVIEAWTEGGSRVAGFELPKWNSDESRPGPWTTDNPPRNLVSSIAGYDAHRLWVVSRHRRPNWRELVVARVSPSGLPYLDPKDGQIASVFRSRIDLLDLNRSAVLASTWHDGLLIRFIEPGVIPRLDYDANGVPLLRALRVTLELR